MKKILLILIVVFSALLILRIRNNSIPKQIEDYNTTTLDPFYIEDLGFWSSSPVSTSLASIKLSWPVEHQEDGLLVFKESDQKYNYLFVLDPVIKDIVIQNTFGDMDLHWQSAQDPVCVINGGFFEPDGSPSFPLIIDHLTLPGAVTNQHPVRTLYIHKGNVLISDTTDNNIAQSQWAISGLNPSYYADDNIITNRTIGAVKDNLLYIIVTRNRSVNTLVTFLESELGIDPAQVVVFDSGFSSQVRCGGQDLLRSSSVMGSTIVIKNR